MEFDDLMRLAGKAGPFQVTMFILLGLMNLYTNLENLAVNFMSPVHEHWCLVPELAHLPQEEILELAIPPSDSKGDAYESCEMYDVTSNGSLPVFDTNQTTSCIYGYMFDQTEFEITATSEFELVCGREWILDIISPAYSVGFLVGALGAGTISDRYGRRTSLLVFTLLHLAAGLGVAFAVNEWMYMFCRMLIATGVRATANTSVVFLMESVASSQRVRAVIGYQMFYGMGGLVLVGFAYFIRHFQWLQLAVIIPLVPMIAYRWIIPESPRWLLMKGRLQQCADAVRYIATKNKRALPEDAVQAFIDQKVTEKSSGLDNTNQQKIGFSILLTHPVVRRNYLVCAWLMMAFNFIFLGINFNIDQLFGDVYINVLVSVMMEFPSYVAFYFFMSYIGRKPALFTANTVMAVCCAGAVILHYVNGMDMGVTVLSIVVRGLASGCICALCCYISELFPTTIRQMAVGSSSAVASVASIFAPLIGGPMKSIWEPLPYVIFGVMAVMSAVFLLLLPETLGQQLPNTIEDVCQLGKQRKPVEKQTASEKSNTIPDGISISTIGGGFSGHDQKCNAAYINPTDAILEQLRYSHEFAYYGPEHYNTKL